MGADCELSRRSPVPPARSARRAPGEASSCDQAAPKCTRSPHHIRLLAPFFLLLHLLLPILLPSLLSSSLLTSVVSSNPRPERCPQLTSAAPSSPTASARVLIAQQLPPPSNPGSQPSQLHSGLRRAPCSLGKKARKKASRKGEPEEPTLPQPQILKHTLSPFPHAANGVSPAARPAALLARAQAQLARPRLYPLLPSAPRA